MGDLQRRGEYRPRQQRERQAYRLVLAGAGSGLAAVVTLVLAVAGVTGALPPIVLVLISVWCVWRLMRVTGQR